MSKIDPSLIPLILMAIVAPLGGIDVVYFHLWKFRLFQQKSSRGETITHLIRGILFPSGALLLFRCQPCGAWFWFVGTLCLLDCINNIADVSLENDSRRPLGGIPTAEYAIHTIGSMFSGAITLSYFILYWSRSFQPTALSVMPANVVPDWLALQGKLFVAGGFFLLFLEGSLFIYSILKEYECCGWFEASETEAV